MTFNGFRDLYYANLLKIRITLYDLSDTILKYPLNTADVYIALELGMEMIERIDAQRANLLMAQTIPYHVAIQKIVNEAAIIAKICASIQIRTNQFQPSRELKENLSEYFLLMQEIIADESYMQLKDWCIQESDNDRAYRLAWEESDPMFQKIFLRAMNKVDSNARSEYFWLSERCQER